jgi:hypothetical protein
VAVPVNIAHMVRGILSCHNLVAPLRAHCVVWFLSLVCFSSTLTLFAQAERFGFVLLHSLPL